MEKAFIKYLKSCKLEVHTTTKARGHQGVYLKNRIDISRDIPKNRIIPTLLHEFAHHIHSKIEPDMLRSGGSLSVLFNTQDVKLFEKELLAVTNLVDSNSKFEKLNHNKKLIKQKISDYENIIKAKYPKFLRSKKFKEFDKYIKKSNAKYLLKYDRVKLVSGILFKKVQLLTIDNIEKDFCDISPEFAAYIRLKSCQRRQARISGRINRLKKYYSKPTELFARFIEGLYLCHSQVRTTAPHVYYQFYELLNCGYYHNLSEVFEILYIPKSL